MMQHHQLTDPGHHRVLSPVSLTLTATLALAALASDAQAQSITSPRGFDSTEGSSDFATFFTSRRLQQIDATQLGHPAVFKQLAFRRNGTFTGRNSLTRTGRFTVQMGHGDYAALDATFAKNYLSPPLTAFTPKPVSIPDWTAKPSTPPAAFDLLLPFDVPFVYDGKRALVFDVVVDSLSRSGDMYVDRENRSYNRQSGTVLGTGCVASGQTSTYSHFLALRNYAPGQANQVRIEHSGGSAPANAPVHLVLGLSDPQAALPGLCASIRTLPLMFLPRTPASASGYLSTQYIDVPYVASSVGLTLYSQYSSPDSGQVLPLALSNGRSTMLPARPVELRCAYHFASPSSTSATVFPGMGVIVRLGL